jgi:hypothetical protein
VLPRRRSGHVVGAARALRGQELELVCEDEVLDAPATVGRLVLILLEPTSQAELVPAPKTLSTAPCLEAEDRGVDVDNAGEPEPGVVAPRHRESDRAADGIGPVLAQLGILDERPDQRDIVHAHARPTAIRFSGMGGVSSCAGPGACPRRPAA